ncbi:MAG: acetoin utilization protein AcuC [Armatimonadetes bacterium]|nr:acetoin utilization protein AcuC [Armatimonadota bacterium]
MVNSKNSGHLFIYHADLLGYNLGAEHPLNPRRLELAVKLTERLGILDDVPVIRPREAGFEELNTAHSADYLNAVKRLSRDTDDDEPKEAARYGFGGGDNPIFPNMYEASALYTGASLQGAEAIIGGAKRVVNLSGGQHHAHWARAAGFCVFNDPVVAIKRLRQAFKKVAYVDVDVHHGDGVQEAFYDDPTVLTLSIHESGRHLFPGTGWVAEMGKEAGKGFAVNLPVAPYTDDESWNYVFQEAALPILRAFQPEAICLQMGADAHYTDPLAHVCLTVQGWLKPIEAVAAMGVPVLALGGGGYNLDNVPRMWALASAVVFSKPLPKELPPDWKIGTENRAMLDPEPVQIPDALISIAKTTANATVKEIKIKHFPIHGLSSDSRKSGA